MPRDPRTEQQLADAYRDAYRHPPEDETLGRAGQALAGERVAGLQDPYTLAVETRDTSIFAARRAPGGTHVSPESCRDGLREAGARRQLAEILRAEAMLDLTDWIAAAHQHMSIVEIARLAGVSRVTVYEALRQRGLH